MEPKIKSGKTQNLKILLKKFKDIASIDKDGCLVYTSFEFFIIEWIFLSMIEFGSDLNVASKRSILSSSIKKVIEDNNFDENYFIEQVISFAGEHNRIEEKEYILLTAISVSKLPFRVIKLGESIIQIHGRQYPALFKKSRETVLKKNSFKKEKISLTKLTVKVKAKDYRDAYSKAFDCLEIFRAFLCLFLNPSFELRFAQREAKPLNKILRGEVATLHTLDGQMANEKFFYFLRDYKDPEIVILDNRQQDFLRKTLKRCFKQFNNCRPKLQTTLSKALVSYVDAFDETSMHAAFIKTWRAIEVLTKTDQNDILIKRCLSLYNKDGKDIERLMLEAIRIFRNEYIHEGNVDQDPSLACYHLQGIIYNLVVRYNLHLSGFFNSIDDSVIFLDNMQLDKSLLVNRKRIIDKALKSKK